MAYHSKGYLNHRRMMKPFATLFWIRELISKKGFEKFSVEYGSVLYCTCAIYCTLTEIIS